MYLKIMLCVVVNEFSFEIGRISDMRAFEIKRVRPNLYGAPCNPTVPKGNFTAPLLIIC